MVNSGQANRRANVASDPICLRIFHEIRAKPANPTVKSPVLGDNPINLTIAELFIIVTTMDLVVEAEQVPTSAGMQKLFEIHEMGKTTQSNPIIGLEAWFPWIAHIRRTCCKGTRW